MSNAVRSKQHRSRIDIKNSLIIITGLSIIWLFYILGYKIPCLFHELTGLYCPGCGITRSIISLINLEFYQAFRYNNIIYIILPLLAIQSYAENKGYKKLSNNITKLCLVISILFMILRNTEKFNFLSPIKL